MQGNSSRLTHFMNVNCPRNGVERETISRNSKFFSYFLVSSDSSKLFLSILEVRGATVALFLSGIILSFRENGRDQRNCCCSLGWATLKFCEHHEVADSFLRVCICICGVSNDSWIATSTAIGFSYQLHSETCETEPRLGSCFQAPNWLLIFPVLNIFR